MCERELAAGYDPAARKTASWIVRRPQIPIGPDATPHARRLSGTVGYRTLLSGHCLAVSDEWHLVLGNALQYIVFGHPSWWHAEVVPLFSPFQSARFIAVETVSDAMNSNRVKQLLVKAPTKR